MSKKGWIFRWLLAPLAFVACGEQEPADGNNGRVPTVGFASFAPSGDSFRSAGDPDNTTLDAITVFAHYTGEANFDEGSTPNFMYKQAITKDASNAWTYSPVKYWPVQGQKVSFFAVAPAPSAGNGIVLSETAGSYVGYPTFTVTPPAMPAEQVDFCLAMPVLNATYADPNGDDNASNNADGQVAFHFAHAMARLTFSAQYESAEDFGIVVGKIELKNLSTSRKLSFVPNAPGFAWGAVEMPATPVEYVLSVVDQTLVHTPLNRTVQTPISTAAGTLMLIPQTLPSDAEMEVTLWVGGEAFPRTATLSPLTLTEGEAYNYTLTIQDHELSDVLDKDTWEYDYTGDWQTFVAPENGTYKFEAWGAGGPGTYDGKGGYVSGTLGLAAGQTIYVYVGGAGLSNGPTDNKPNTSMKGGWNGGGDGHDGWGNSWHGSGSGATDFRLLGGSWNDATSLNSRIMVAGGGGAATSGGSGFQPGATNKKGGNGGGLSGGDAESNTGTPAHGGTQIQGGAGGKGSRYTKDSGKFGSGGSGDDGAGGGYYGGGAGGEIGGYEISGGGGGSSFISGMTNCVAIDPTSKSEPRAQDTGGLKYNGAVFGTSPTWVNGAEIVFADYVMMDGAGYEWTSGTKAESATNNMPDWKPGGSTMTGNTGKGYARITRQP